ncbi:MAG TPA: hypothetical protein VJ506_00035, partial [Candidatus Limnocylindrales bacterium]|nr:hypothetical protein [Candidatus Limnocylindrales bacterium]
MTPSAAARSTIAGSTARSGAGPVAASPLRARRSDGRRGVLADIAVRRRADLQAELAGIGEAELQRRARAAPPPRSIAERLAAPGLHLIAELKRSSPSAGRIARDGEDLVARARAYERGGATAISVLCEPHWFGGSLADLEAVRAAVAIPVLAKEFVVDRRQLAMLRAAGADLVLLLAALHPRRALARLVDEVLALGLEPLVEAHDEREVDAALASRARLVGLNNRDLRTLEVDPERAVALRARVPEDRLVIAESGVRDVETIRAWRAVGFDGALVGEALMRADAPEEAAASFVAAGRAPDDLVNAANRGMVKICGIRDEDGLRAAVAAGADAIGLNLVPGTPRFLELDVAANLAREARRWSAVGQPVAIVAVTVDLGPGDLERVTDVVDPDVIQLSGDEPPSASAGAARPTWKVLHVPPRAALDRAAIDRIVEAGRAHLAAGAARVMLDASGGLYPGGTGQRLDPATVAAIARELPVVLAGGLDPATVGPALRSAPIVGVDVASGVERPRRHGERPLKDPFRVGLFAKRARAARDDRPNLAVRPSLVAPELEEADPAGRWGLGRELGGRYVPETLVAALEELDVAWTALRDEPRFWAELRERLATFAGRPTPLSRADRLGAALLSRAAEIGRPAARVPASLRLYLKREDLAHTGAHKINNALGQALLTRRLGKSRVIAETGA